MGITSLITGYIAPIFIIISPITSYADQTLAIHRQKSSAGFSMDIPLIMLVASMLRIFYFPGAHFESSLLIQAIIMISIQLVLLKVALDNRPSPSSKGGELATPFSQINTSPRPFDFWQWKSPKPYWQFLLYLFITLTSLELILGPFPSTYALYSQFIGYLGLGIEATLPLPQMLSNYREKSCKGFRLSVLASWLAGDVMKMFWFFNAGASIPWAFKLCGGFQAICDLILGGQYAVFGAGDKTSGGRQGAGKGKFLPIGMTTPMEEKNARLE